MGHRSKAKQMMIMQIRAHVEGQKGQWALAAAKNDLVRMWKGIDKKEEALALHEVAKIYLAFREPANVVKTGREALALLQADTEIMTKVNIIRTMMQVYIVDEDKQDLNAAERMAEECLELGETSKLAQAYGKLWSGRIQSEKFFQNYIPKITLWKSPTYSGKRNEKDLKIKDYEKAMKLIDDAYLIFEKEKDEEGMQEAFETAYAVKQKVNQTQDPTKATHIFKNGKFDHSEYSYD